MNEDELQKRIESGEKLSEEDRLGYEYIFGALKQEPKFTMSADFADRVVKIVEAKKQSIIAPEFFWFGVGVLVLFGATLFVMYSTNFTLNISFNLGFLSGMSSYSGLVIFGAVFITLLNWIDKKFLRHSRTV